MRLCAGRDQTPVGETDIGEWLQSELKKNRSEVFELNTKFGTAPLKEQIAIRGSILQAGLPGDPILRRMWAMQSAVDKE